MPRPVWKMNNCQRSIVKSCLYVIGLLCNDITKHFIFTLELFTFAGYYWKPEEKHEPVKVGLI